MNRSRTWTWMAVVCLVGAMCATRAQAQETSRVIPFNNVQTSLPAETTQTVTVKIFDAASEGTEIFAEAHTVNVDASQLISFLLGSQTTGELDPAVFPSGASRYADVVDRDGLSALVNRIPLYATAFAVSPGAPGSVSPAGLNTASNTPGVYHIVATSAADPSPNATATGFLSTGSMSTPRLAHTATRLTDGRVLIAGGWDTFGLATAELYDPAMGTFASGCTMTMARYAHKATLLDNGSVLLSGGCNGSPCVFLTNGELYDSTSGTFGATGSMITARVHHTATLLRDGKVLIVGGLGTGGFLASAELYDPAAGGFTPAGTLVRGARGLPTATMLNDGRVLIAGGARGTGCCGLTEADLYDPATGTLTPTDSMRTGRWGHSAILLPNGSVLVAGGVDPNNRITSSAELYDPATGRFGATGPLRTGSFGHTATRLNDGGVLITGGYGFAIGPLARAELYDPITGTFAAAGNMSTGRHAHTATSLCDGRVLITGGCPDQSCFVSLASAELYQGESALESPFPARTAPHGAAVDPTGQSAARHR